MVKNLLQINQDLNTLAIGEHSLSDVLQMSGYTQDDADDIVTPDERYADFMEETEDRE